MIKKWICAILGCLLLLVLASCKDDKTNEAGSTESSTTPPKTEDVGEPSDPNNQYAKDNDAYYKDAWKR